jgi:hypothetical protein
MHGTGREFRKLGSFSRPVRVPFCRGHLDGYVAFGGPPDGFRRLYAVRLAMTASWAVVWGAVPDDRRRAERPVPRWYARRSGAR